MTGVLRPEDIRLAYVTEWFPPEPSRAWFWVAEALRDVGFEIGIVTGSPYYPGSRVLEGYRARDWRVETCEGFRVLRVPEFPSHDSSAIRRIASYSSFAASSALLATPAIRRADVSLVFMSPASSALAAMTARVGSGTPYVLHVHDLWPDSIFATGFLTTPLVRAVTEPAVNAFVQASYHGAAHICAITPGIRRAIIERGVPAEKVTLVYNWADESTLRPVPGNGWLRSRLGVSADAFVALYAGNLGEAQALTPWIAAMARLPDLPDVHLVFMGDGTQYQALRSHAAASGLDGRIHFIGSVTPADVAPIVADADASVVSLADRALFRVTLPSKVQASLAMASPLIASVTGDAAEVISAADAGWVARPEDPGSIAAAVRAAHSAGAAERTRRGRSGYDYYQANMARRFGAERLASVLIQAANTRRSR